MARQEKRQEVAPVEIEFANSDLEGMATDANQTCGYAQAIVKKYRHRLQLIQAAADERDFYALKSLHYEKLKGDRSHQRSMRLNDQWRLVIEVVKKEEGRTVRVIEINDYH